MTTHFYEETMSAPEPKREGPVERVRKHGVLIAAMSVTWYALLIVLFEVRGITDLWLIALGAIGFVGIILTGAVIP